MVGNYTVFNPCFIGLASATFFNPQITALIGSFQSLFYWISLCNSIYAAHSDMIEWSFNPCFIGLASATLWYKIPHLPLAKFQSLFYWISLCNRAYYHRKRGEVLFQSLFYWISLCNGRYRFRYR